MKFGAHPASECAGFVLAHSVMVGERRLSKGRTLTRADCSAAAAAGISSLVVAVAEQGDVAEDEAATRLGAALSSGSVVADAAVHGRVNLRAGKSGLFRVDARQVARLNDIDEAITLATLETNTPVRSGAILATIKIIPFFVADEALQAALEAAAPPLLHPFKPLRVDLVQTELAGTSEKMLAKTRDVTAQRIETLGGRLTCERRVPHNVAALAKELKNLSGDMILVAGASATSDRRDIVPAAIDAAGGTVKRLGMPVDPGNLLLLGAIDDRTVIGLPGCARSPRRNGFDFVLERLFAGLPVTSADIAAMGVGGLLAEADRPQPRTTRSVHGIQNTGILVLAAGRAARMGHNKLHADLGGKPLLLHAVDAAEIADLPFIVVTGHDAETTRALLAKNVQTVHAADHSAGIGRSLAAGIAAIPDEWDAVIIMLADMPLVEPRLLRDLAAAARTEADIVVPVRGERRGNPVLWGRDHFGALLTLEGDVGGKAALADRLEFVKTIEAPSDAIFMDVDTPAALEAVRAAYIASKSSGD